MARRKGRSCLGLNTGRVVLSSTGVRTRIALHGNENSACRDFNRRGMPRAFCRRSAPSLNIFVPGGICGLPPSTAKR
jgi:hypothetical protein